MELPRSKYWDQPHFTMEFEELLEQHRIGAEDRANRGREKGGGGGDGGHGEEGEMEVEQGER